MLGTRRSVYLDHNMIYLYCKWQMLCRQPLPASFVSLGEKQEQGSPLQPRARSIKIRFNNVQGSEISSLLYAHPFHNRADSPRPPVGFKSDLSCVCAAMVPPAQKITCTTMRWRQNHNYSRPWLLDPCGWFWTQWINPQHSRTFNTKFIIIIISLVNFGY